MKRFYFFIMALVGLVVTYVKEGKNGDWQLVSESWNQEQVYLP